MERSPTAKLNSDTRTLIIMSCRQPSRLARRLNVGGELPLNEFVLAFTSAQATRARALVHQLVALYATREEKPRPLAFAETDFNGKVFFANDWCLERAAGNSATA
jgi:hypothetical protein